LPRQNQAASALKTQYPRNGSGHANGFDRDGKQSLFFISIKIGHRARQRMISGLV
jgi:hypothetical protein